MSRPGVGSGATRDATDLASAALIGALLWHPERARDVSSWLHPDDLSDPAHRAIYQTIVGMQRDGVPVELRQLPAELRRGTYHQMPVDTTGRTHGPLGGPALHTLLSMTPAASTASGVAGQDGAGPRASTRSEHVRYARLVLDSSIRRQIEAAGTRITQYATSYLPRQDSGLAVRGLEPVLAELTTRLGQLTAQLGAAAVAASPIAAAMNPTPQPGGQMVGQVPAWQLAGEEVFMTDGRLEASTPEQLARAEHALLGACMSSPTVRGLALEVLVAEDFTRADAAETWRAIGELHRRGEPIDFVLVAAQLEQRDTTTDPERDPGIPAEQLMHLAHRFPDVVTGYAAMQVVVRSAISNAAQNAGEQLRELAGDRSQPTEAMLRDAHAALTRMRDSTGRLSRSAPAAARAALTPPAARVPTARSAPRPTPAVPTTAVPTPHQDRARQR